MNSLVLLMMFWLQATGDTGRLAARIQALITGPAAAGARATPDVAVVLLQLDGQAAVSLQPDVSFHAASTMKVPVMIELFRQAEAGTVRLDDRLPVRNEFHSIVDGSVYTMDVSEDSDAEVYKAIGTTMTLRDLNEAMITVSSNFAANLLIEKVGAENVRKTVERLGGKGMLVLRGVEDQKAFDKGLNNATTAEALAVLMERIAKGKAVSQKADAEMIAILKRQKFHDAIPAGVPEGIAVAHKTGNITRIHHDAAVVYGPRPYVLVVLVRGIQEQKVSGPLMASISKEIWEAVR